MGKVGHFWKADEICFLIGTIFLNFDKKLIEKIGLQIRNKLLIWTQSWSEDQQNSSHYSQIKYPNYNPYNFFHLPNPNGTNLQCLILNYLSTSTFYMIFTYYLLTYLLSKSKNLHNWWISIHLNMYLESSFTSWLMFGVLVTWLPAESWQTEPTLIICLA